MTVHRVVAAAAALWFLLQHMPAHGGQARVVKYNINDRGPFAVNATVNRSIILSFPSEVELAKASSTSLGLEFQKYSYEVRLYPSSGATSASMKVFTKAHTIPVFIRVVPRDKSIDRAEFYDGHAVEEWLSSNCEARFNETFSRLAFNGVTKKRLAHAPMSENALLQVENPKLLMLGDRHLFNFRLKNHRNPTLALETIRVYGDDNETEHTLFFQVMSTDEIITGKHLVEIPKRKSVQVNVMVDNLDHLGQEAYIQLVGVSGLALATEKISFIDPPPPENYGRLAIQGEALTGTVNLKNTADTNQTDFTSFRGAGLRAVLGLTNNLSLEAALSLVFSGKAQFEDSTTAEATTGRILAGGILHTAGTYVAFARVGIGARVADYTTVDTDASAPRVSGIWRLGAGVEAWLGETLVAGLSANFVGPFGGGNDESFSVEFGLHLGFAWKVLSKDW